MWEARTMYDCSSSSSHSTLNTHEYTQSAMPGGAGTANGFCENLSSFSLREGCWQGQTGKLVRPRLAALVEVEARPGARHALPRMLRVVV